MGTHLAHSAPASPAAPGHARWLGGSHALRPLSCRGLRRHVTVLLYMPQAGRRPVWPGRCVHGAPGGTSVGPLRSGSRHSIRLGVLVANRRGRL